MVTTLLAQKKRTRQVWDSAGKRLLVTQLVAAGNVVTRIVGAEDKGTRVQIGFGDKKMHNMAKPQRSQLEKAGVTMGKQKFREVFTTSEVTPGQVITVEAVFAPGDLVQLSGTIKGRGWGGVVKRWGFKGGPRTHGQSDRERAPGAIGSGTTIGRVFRNQRMAGHYGNTTETLDNRQIIAVDPTTQTIWIRGTVPGAFNSFVELSAQGKGKVVELDSASLTSLIPAVAAPAVAVAVEPEVVETPVVAETPAEVTETVAA
jgi:large subunit ribosomal protein L3